MSRFGVEPFEEPFGVEPRFVLLFGYDELFDVELPDEDSDEPVFMSLFGDAELPEPGLFVSYVWMSSGC